METENTHRLIADDLFAGAGGWDIAADWLDIHARGVENMPPPVLPATLRV